MNINRNKEFPLTRFSEESEKWRKKKLTFVISHGYDANVYLTNSTKRNKQFSKTPKKFSTAFYFDFK